MNTPIILQPIGVVHSPFQDRQGIPRQSVGAWDFEGTIEVYEDFESGLTDIEGFSHLQIIFHFNQIQETSLIAHPPWDDKPHGVFATRSPYRPNGLGISVVQLQTREENLLRIRGIDMANGSPVLDIKPYVPQLNPQEDIRVGWLEGKVDTMNSTRSGDR